MLALICLLAVPGRAQSPVTPSAGGSTNEQTYQGTGVVQRLEADGKTVVIKHEAMPFVARNTNELEGLRNGDAVAFRLVVTAKEGWIDHITKTGTVQVVDSSQPSFIHIVQDVDPLAVGDVLPDTQLTNELGGVISTGKFKGQALAFTFFFTRCPYPNFCPFLSTSFEDAQKKLEATTNGPTNWHLISISFDPDNDTPAALKAYAVGHDYDPEHWSFGTSGLVELTALGDRFGEYFGRDSTGSVTHNLRTVILDTHGRVQKIFQGNTWTSDDLVAEIVKAARN